MASLTVAPECCGVAQSVQCLFNLVVYLAFGYQCTLLVYAHLLSCLFSSLGISVLSIVTICSLLC